MYAEAQHIPHHSEKHGLPHTGVGVFLYIVVYQIIVAKKYLAYTAISGMVRVQAEGPQSYLPVSAVPYCTDSVDSFIPAWQRSPHKIVAAYLPFRSPHTSPHIAFVADCPV